MSRIPYPIPTSDAASTRMRANRRRDTRPEIALRSALHALGHRYRVDEPVGLPGRRPVRPDVVFTRARVCVFVDGCFWHGCPLHGVEPNRNVEYWGPKLARNVARDLAVNEALESGGWVVLRFWEHEDPIIAAGVIAAVVGSRRRDDVKHTEASRPARLNGYPAATHGARSGNRPGSSGRTVTAMGAHTPDRKSAPALAAAVAAFEAHQAALRAQLGLLDERDRAIVRAIRAGARLEEAAEAAMISRAAVSKAARRSLPSRTGRGGPYSRRRGSSAALDAVAEAARSLAAARERTREAKAHRDGEIANAVANGAGVSEAAGAIGMTPASVSVIARSGRTRKATNAGVGAVASRTR